LSTSVERAVEALTADFLRQGGKLTRAQVERTIIKRDLNPDDIVQLQSLLAQSEVQIDDEEPDKASASSSSDREDVGAVPTNPFSHLFSDSGAKTLLSRQEEIELARRLRLGEEAKTAIESGGSSNSIELRAVVRRGEEAKKRLISANLRLVLAWARKYNRASSMDLNDLFQEGVLGLIGAVERFDPTLGVKFSTYAVWWIRQAITRGLGDQDRAIRLPIHRVEQVHRLRRIRRWLRYENGGREPTIRELAEALDYSADLVAFIRSIENDPCISTENPIGVDEGLVLGDTLISQIPSPADQFEQAEREALIRKSMERLAPRQSRILERRFGINNDGQEDTLEAIGEDMNLTRERIRQIESKALDKIAPILREIGLDDAQQMKTDGSHREEDSKDANGKQRT
jgi:RNA polymerase primary sigma factor